jgi:hypothetical protein
MNATLVIRLLCERGLLRCVGQRPVREGDLPADVKGRVIRFEIEGGTEADVAAASPALAELVRVTRARGAAGVETVRKEPPAVMAGRALEADVLERSGETSVDALVQWFGERMGRLQCQAGADRLAVELQRAGEKCSAVELAVYVIAWCASRSHRAALVGFLASVRAAELGSRERRESMQ